MSTPILTAADLDRLPERTRVELLARDGGTTINTTFRDRMLAAANSAIAVWTRGAFPQGLVASGHAPDDIFIEWALDIFCYLAASKHTNAAVAKAYTPQFELAKASFRSLTRGQDPAPVTSGTSAEPTSVALGAVEVPTSFWGDPADGFGGAGGF